MGEHESSDDLQRRVADRFQTTFGTTSLPQRIADIERQTLKLKHPHDLQSVRQAAGDLLASVLQLANEQDWPVDLLVTETLARIDRRREIYAKLGRRLRVGILDRAFDPPHDGHVTISRAVIESGLVDVVWWMPCDRHLTGRRMVDAERRLEMCRLAAAGLPDIEVSDFQIRHRFSGPTYQLAKKLLADEAIDSRCVLHLILSSDTAESMQAVNQFAALQRLMPVIVVPHVDLAEPPADAWFRNGPHHYLGDSERPPRIRSTEVRRALAAERTAKTPPIPSKVLAYIDRHGLYQRPQHATPAQPIGKLPTALMVGSFDPPTTAQVSLVRQLLDCGFDSVKILPAARLQAGLVIEHADTVHRAALLDLTFGGHPRVDIDCRGLEDERAVAPATLMRTLATEQDLWFVVADETVAGRGTPTDLREAWDQGERLWERAGFIIVTHSAETLDGRDLPPRHRVVPLPEARQPLELREQIARGVDVSEWVPEVAIGYIRRHRLFQPVRWQTQWPVRWESPRVRLVYDSRNERALRLADRYQRWEAAQADLILVIGGDGTMLHAIREHWRLRLPFVGINAGHLGFLMNQDPFKTLENLEVNSYRMPMLRTRVESVTGGYQEHLAFSDAWIERQTGQAAWLSLEVDGETRVSKVVGDGLLVATPSGSSSYARAMGATPVPLDTQSLTIAGSNIFRPRFWRPLMMPADAQVRIRTLDDSGKRPVQAFVDGATAGRAESIDVCRSRIAAVELAFARDSDLSAKLLASLLPAESGRY